jgi:hypothetical protein
MARITNISNSAWSSPITFDARELWQVQEGSVLFSFGTSTPADASDGLILDRRDVIEFEDGEIIRYRRNSSSPAVLVRQVRTAT